MKKFILAIIAATTVGCTTTVRAPEPSATLESVQEKFEVSIRRATPFIDTWYEEDDIICENHMDIVFGVAEVIKRHKRYRKSLTRETGLELVDFLSKMEPSIKTFEKKWQSGEIETNCVVSRVKYYESLGMSKQESMEDMVAEYLRRGTVFDGRRHTVAEKK